LNRKTRSAISTAASVGIIVIIIIAGAAAYLYYSSTNGTSTTTTTQQLTGSLNVITFTDPSNAWLQAAADSFMAAHPGVSITVTAQGFSSYTTTEMTSLKAQSPTYDIITDTSTSALGFAQYVLNLNGKISLDTSDIPAPQLNFGGYYALPNGTNELIGVPYDTATFSIFYNQTLLSNPTLNTLFQKEYGFSMSPPR
jgi:ABC-type glycerol-3-phosphate transport system substrate-binding protein